MLVDSDVLIWYLRGNENAFLAINELDGFEISVVTYIEIVQGMRNKTELTSFRKALKKWNVKIIYINIKHAAFHKMFLVHLIIMIILYLVEHFG